MASVTRQPFAPLDGARLQNLTSLKNRQNALPSPSAGKRKADLLDTDDSENVDPLLFTKRTKAAKGQTGSSNDTFLKPSAFHLTSKPMAKPHASPIPAMPLSMNSTPRRSIPSKTPSKLNTGITKSSSLTVPAGRSPTRGKRSGILSNRRRSAVPYSRIDPLGSNLGGGAAPFSLDAALKGTIPDYASRPAAPKPVPATPLGELDMKASWFFDIHEDTAEQEMTNMLQHGTCVLDISSDEESEQKARREGREDKENVPPVDDVSQTSGRRSTRRAVKDDEMVVEKERVALGALNTADFYPEGVDELSVIIVPADEEDEPQQDRITGNFEFAPELKTASTETMPKPEPELVVEESIDALIAKPSTGSSKAAVLQPIEGTGESFELWESGSAKDDGEGAPARPAEVTSS